MKIVFAGTPDLSVPILEALIKSEHEIIAVYTQPDRPSGRGRHLHESAVKIFAQQHNLPIYQPAKLTEFPHEDIDAFVVAIYGLLIPEFILRKPKYGCINVHPSLLPRWRGAAPIIRPLLAGDTETGVTIMQMEKGMDTGDILSQVSCPILSTDNIKTLEEKLSAMGAELLINTLNNLDNIKPIKQDELLVTHAHKINKSDAEINWTQSAEEINRQIRGFYPAYSYLDNQLVKFWYAVALPQSTTLPPGTIIHSDAIGIDISTGKNILKLLKLQLAGGKPLGARDMLNSRAEMFAEGKRFTPHAGPLPEKS
ncbi:MAG TPA: methionyl-tRNA formyltransferase [Gammaproteobacteria bacterium]|nr:methionyl-tRNA formyltransferase [Gammaproteobacteria bacterium]